MNTTVEVICYRSKTLADGKSPLMLRLTKNRKRKYLSLHMSVNPIFWDFNKNKPKRNCPDKEAINKIIELKIQAYQKQITDYTTEEKDFTLNTLVTKVSKPVIMTTFGAYIDHYLSILKAETRIGYAKTFEELKFSIEHYYKTLDFYFSDIDYQWLNGYELWLRKRNNSENTIGIRFRTLRALYNKALINNMAKTESYPFRQYNVSRLHEETAKRSITRDSIKEIIAFDVSTIPEAKIKELQLSKDIFLFSYLGCGMNLTDIAMVRERNIVDNRLTYNRQKTGKLLSYSLQPLALEIIERNRKSMSSNNDYIFPILFEERHISPTQIRDRIKKLNKVINGSLKIIGNQLNIPIKLTTYVARHSFATVLKRSGVSTAIISESLGHSSEKVTQIYLDSFENEQINKAMEFLV